MDKEKHTFRNGIKGSATSNNTILKMFKTPHKTVRQRTKQKNNTKTVNRQFTKNTKWCSSSLEIREMPAQTT